jgi:flagellar hook assembly protein FlgD
MDPHPTKGHYRALTGDLGMTAAEFRAGAGTLAPKAESPGKKQKRPDRTAPKLKLTGVNGSSVATAATAVRFTPNGDGVKDALRIRRSITERARIRVQVRDRKDRLVRTFTRTVKRGAGTITWNGRDSKGKVVPEGRYTLQLRPRDMAGNTGKARTLDAVVLTSLLRVTPDRRAIDASDRDRFGESVRVSFKLTKRAKVRIQVRDEQGRVVRTALGGTFKAGQHAWRWDGRDAKGRFVKDGAYSIKVTSTTAAGSMSTTRPIHVGAFRIVPSDTTVKRGRQLKVTIVSTEPLRKAPTLTVRQPGSTRTITTRKVEPGRFKAVFKVRNGKTGTLRLRVKGTDRAGGTQIQARDLRLR